MRGPWIHVAPTDVAPGQPTPVVVTVVNGEDRARGFVVRAVGLADSWVSPPIMTEPIPPLATVEVELLVSLPFGFPASHQTVGIVAEPTDGSAPVRADAELVVGDGGGLRLALEPADLHGARRASFGVRLTNGGSTDLDIDLESQVPAGRLRVRFDPSAVRVPAGATVRVGGRVSGSRPAAGRTRRLPFLVAARGTMTPTHAEGSFSQSPVLSGGVLKVMAIVVVLSLWIGAMAFALDRFTDRDDDGDTATAQQASDDGTDGGGAGDGSGAGDGGGADGEGGGAGGDGAGEGGEGADDGEGGEEADGGATAGSAAATGAKVGGTVEAREPGGVTVRIEPITLVEERTQGATLVNVRRPLVAGKRAGPALQVSGPGSAPARTTTTDDTGSWAFAGVEGPGFFLITFSKAGYAERNYVIEVTDDGAPVELDVLLEAGPGSISGSVFADGELLGGVDISVTDGTVVLGTRTPTSGDGVGTWRIDGLTTPGTYLVSASRRGYGTETALVELGGGASSSVDLSLVAGVGSLTGIVSSTEGPVGGVTVTVTDGTITRTSTTVTEGPVGSYALPQLPIPGTYTLTVEGDGWATATREVELTDDLELPLQIEPTTGAVFGSITGIGGVPLPGVGVTLEGGDLVLKNTSVETPPGSYEITGVPPGTYVVSFSLFGFETESTVIELTQGELRRLDMAVDDPIPLEVPRESTITGRVVDSLTGDGVGGATVTILRQPDIDPQTTLSDGSFTFSDLPPGVFTLSITADNYEPGQERATVAVSSGTTLPIRLIPLATLSGVVRSQFNGALLANATVDLVAVGRTPPFAGDPVTTDTSGNFHFPRVRAGTYEVVATEPAHVPLADPPNVTVSAGQDITGVDIALPRVGRLRVFVLRPQGGNAVLATGAEITLTPVGGSPASPVVVDELPEVFGLASDSYRIGITLDGHQSRTTVNPVPVPLNSQVDRYFVLTPDREAVSGEIVYLLNGVDEPVAGGSFTVTGLFGFSDPNDGSPVSPVPSRTTSAPELFTNGVLLIPGTKVPLDGIGDLRVTANGFNTLVVNSVDLDPDVPQRLVMTPLPGTASINVTFNPSTPGGTPAGQVISAPPGVTGVQVVAGFLPNTLVLRHPPSSTGVANSPLGARVPVGDYVVRVTAPDHIARDVPLQVRPPQGNDTESVTLPREGSITVTSEGVPSGNPTATATAVTATFTLTQVTPAGGPAPIVQTGSLVTFPDLNPDNVYRLTVAAGPDFVLTSTLSDIDLDPGENRPIDVDFRILGRLSGRVMGDLNGTQSPLENVLVRATGPDPETTTFDARTDATGRFEIIGLEAGTYDVAVVGPLAGWDIATGVAPDEVVAGDATTDVGDLVVDALPATLSGRVTDGSGNDLDGVLVRVRTPAQADPIETTTANGGLYEITGLVPLNVNVEFSLLDHASVTVVGVPLPKGDTFELNVALPPQLNTITGRVAATFGNGSVTRPVPNATVEVQPVSGGAAVATGTTGTDGRFTIPNLRTGDYRVVLVRPAGYEAPTTPPPQLSVTGGVTRDVGTFTIRGKTQDVVVTVESVDGGVSGAPVTLTATTGGGGVTQGPTPTSGTGGTVRFTDVVPGTYTASAAAANGHEGGGPTSTITVVPTDTTADLTATITLNEGKLTGVFDAVCGGSTGGTIAAGGKTAVVADGGTYTLFLAPGTAVAVTGTPDDGTFTTATGSVSITVGDTTTFDADVTRCGDLEVTVTNTAGNVNGTTIDITGPENRSATVQNNNDVPKVFEDLPAGSYTVVATRNGNSDSDTVSITAGGTTQVSLDVTPPLVPDVVGQTESAATTNLEAAGFVVAVTNRVASGSETPGNVVEQSPAGDTRADTGSTVTITVATPPPSPPGG